MDYTHRGIRDPKVTGFVASVGRDQRLYLDKERKPAAVVAANRDSIFHAMALREYLLLTQTLSMESTAYAEYIDKTKPPSNRDDLRGRVLFVINGSSIRSDRANALAKSVAAYDIVYLDHNTRDPLASIDIEDYEFKGTRDSEIQRFSANVGQRVKIHLRGRNATVITIPTGGTFYGMALREALMLNGVNTNYAEYRKDNGSLYTRDVSRRVVIVVDDSVVAGTAYRKVMGPIKSRARKKKILDVRYAVGRDQIGIADFSVPIKREETSFRKDNKIPPVYADESESFAEDLFADTRAG